jgi:hypothetical protein
VKAQGIAIPFSECLDELALWFGTSCEVAAQMGVGRDRVSAWLSGQCEPSLANKAKARALLRRARSGMEPLVESPERTEVTK